MKDDLIPVYRPRPAGADEHAERMYRIGQFRGALAEERRLREHAARLAMGGTIEPARRRRRGFWGALTAFLRG